MTFSGKVTGVEIFKVGTWMGSRKVEANAAMLEEMVQNFSDVNSIPGYGVPVKLGHTAGIGDPAYGWVTHLSTDGTTLFADFGSVPPEIVDAIGKRRYNSTSIELMPKLLVDGKTFNNVLSGVALLGAEWPAVKGLKPLSAAQFAENVEKLELSQMSNETVKFTQKDADALVFAAEQRVRTEMQALVNEATAKTTAAETRATVAETALKLSQKDARTAIFGAIVDAAIAKGVLLPKQRETTLAFAENFPAEVKIGDKTVKAADAFKEWVDGLPTKVNFNQQTFQKKIPAPSNNGGNVKAADAVHEATTAYLAQNPALKGDYEAAMNAVFAADPELKARYATEM